MANIEDCPGFEAFGSDGKAAREALNISRRALAEQVSLDPRYLANIELEQTVPSVPVVLQLIRICKLPVERYYINVIPTILGNGIRLFDTFEKEIRLKLIKTRSYNGITDLVYERR